MISHKIIPIVIRITIPEEVEEDIFGDVIYMLDIAESILANTVSIDSKGIPFIELKFSAN